MNPICATVETEDGLRVPVKLLDCDTISQAKEKLLDSMHKAAPVSKRPKLTEVDLGMCKVLPTWSGLIPLENFVQFRYTWPALLAYRAAE